MSDHETDERPAEQAAEEPVTAAPAEDSEATPAPTFEPEPTGPRRRVVVVIGESGRRPVEAITEEEAALVLAAVSAPWHPAILERLDDLPVVEPSDAASEPREGEVRLVAGRAVFYVDEETRVKVHECGARLLTVEAGESDRNGLARMLLEALEPGADLGEIGDRTAGDFMALGTARWWLRDLTIGMDHVDVLDHESLTREARGGASAWRSGDEAGAVNRLRACFELLTEARERFYPVDAFLVDLHLLDTTTQPEAIGPALEAHAPFTLLAPAEAVESLADRSPETAERMRAAIDEGWLDVVGGPLAETAEGLLPLESVLWQFRAGALAYRRHLDDRTVETLAGRRFGLYPLRPQIAKRFGFRFGLHMAFDAGVFPVAKESKRLWESPDGASLESLTRPPLAADRASTGLFLAWDLAKSMRNDHVATVGLLHWPDEVADWYRDLRRVATYSPVMARWATVGDYFHLTDRPFEVLRPKLDQYASPYLDQAVARDDPGPIATRARHVHLRARLDAADATRALAWAIEGTAGTAGDGLPPDLDAFDAAEAALESGRLDEAEEAIGALERRWSEEAARLVVGPDGSAAAGATGGVLVLNPQGITRRVPVRLPDEATPPTPEGPVRASQFTAEGVEAVVTAPAFGYAWVPSASAASPSGGPSEAVRARGRMLRNEMIQVEFDESTGGLRAVMTSTEDSARLAQQLVIAGLDARDRDGQPLPSRMRGESFEVEYGGPALMQAVSSGSVLHPVEDRSLFRFRQRVRLWSGRPVAELEMEVSDLDPAWLRSISGGPAWKRYLACRWAWADASSSLRRSSLLGLEATTSDRPETAEVFELSARRQRTALLFGGLAHHQKHGSRMLDTLLVAGREEARSFRVGIALDLEYPFQAALDFVSPPLVVPTSGGPPRTGPTGWFFQLDGRSVAVTRVVPVMVEGEGRGLAFHLLETAGRSVRCRLRLFREPVAARQTDFNDERIIELTISGDAVLLDLTPHELARVVVSLG